MILKFDIDEVIEERVESLYLEFEYNLHILGDIFSYKNIAYNGFNIDEELLERIYDDYYDIYRANRDIAKKISRPDDTIQELIDEYEMEEEYTVRLRDIAYDHFYEERFEWDQFLLEGYQELHLEHDDNAYYGIINDTLYDFYIDDQDDMEILMESIFSIDTLPLNYCMLTIDSDGFDVEGEGSSCYFFTINYIIDDLIDEEAALEIIKEYRDLDSEDLDNIRSILYDTIMDHPHCVYDYLV